jgi:opacity protein-like surface antigen
MKYLVKLFVVIITFSMTTELFAQNFGIKGGLNFSNILLKDDDDTYSNDFKMKPGFHVGATAEFPLTKMISFETGLLLSTKGYKTSEEETYMGETYKYEEKINLFYLDIPLTAKASFDLGGVKIYGVFGPYLGMGLSGKYKYEETYDGETDSEEEDIEWGSDEDNDDLKRLDFGLTLGAGVEIKSIQIGLTYDLGLANISTDNDNGYKGNNRVLGISVGYKFGRK